MSYLGSRGSYDDIPRNLNGPYHGYRRGISQLSVSVNEQGLHGSGDGSAVSCWLVLGYWVSDN